MYGCGWVLWDQLRYPTAGTDFHQLYFAAIALRHGMDPYVAVGINGTLFRIGYPLYYPMPAILAALPLSFLSPVAAASVLVALSSGLLAYALTRTAWWPLVIFMSGAYIEAARLAQWSILFSASLICPLVALAFPIKPTLGAIVGVSVPWSRRTAGVILAGWAVLVAASFVVSPHWVTGWRSAVEQAPHIRAFIFVPGGVLLLLGILRWRRLEGRMLVLYALVPHTRLAYEALPILATSRDRKSLVVLSTLSMCAYAFQALFMSGHDPLMVKSAELSLWLIYVPALVMVLREPHSFPTGNN